MKKTKYALALVSAALLFTAIGCGDDKPYVPSFSFYVALDNGETSIKMGDETVSAVAVSYDGTEANYTYTSGNTDVLLIDEETGEITPVAPGLAYIYATADDHDELTKSIRVSIYSALAEGAISYNAASYATKGEILGKLEAYAMDNNLTGVPLFENGGYVMYQPTVHKASETYIPGYGFGILAEGDITQDMPAANEPKAEWRRYYHSAASSDPKNINQLDADGSEVSDLASYISSSFWGTKMNATKTGYDWYGVLSKDDRPTAINPDSHGFSDTWTFKVKTGRDGLKYDTLSAKRSSFKNRDVAPEDYKFALMWLLNGFNNYYRGSELVGDDTFGIKGAASYFNATKSLPLTDENFDQCEAIFDQYVRYLVVDDGTDTTITVQLVSSQNDFYAMYGLTSAFYQPLPRDFIKAIKAEENPEYFGAFVEKTHTSPVDNILSLSPYTLESWEEGKAIAFKRNPNWIEFATDTSRYNIPGVKVTVYPGATTDPNLVFNEFLAGNVHACGLPQAYVSQYKSDPRTTTTTGDSVFKLNVNSCTQERWIELFGEHGTITETPVAQYYQCKPWMSNYNFLRGINTAINREEFASKRGYVASNNYFASAYMIDPEDGISYNSTQDHADAMEGYYPETFGFNKDAAIDFFSDAVRELVASNDLQYGTRSNPTKINIDIMWMYQSDIEEYGNDVSKYIQDAFNDEQVCGKTIQLTVNNDAVTVWSDVYYKHLMVGQFDLGFGSISGNTLNPLNFMEVLCSSNSSGFTLNWGPDTTVVDPELQYDGKVWSYDGLWNAADHGACFDEKGNMKPIFTGGIDLSSSKLAATGVDVKIEFAWDKANVDLELDALLLDLLGIGTLTLLPGDYIEIDEDNTFVINEDVILDGFYEDEDLNRDADDFLSYYLMTGAPLPEMDKTKDWHMSNNLSADENGDYFAERKLTTVVEDEEENLFTNFNNDVNTEAWTLAYSLDVVPEEMKDVWKTYHRYVYVCGAQTPYGVAYDYLDVVSYTYADPDDATKTLNFFSVDVTDFCVLWSQVSTFDDVEFMLGYYNGLITEVYQMLDDNKTAFKYGYLATDLPEEQWNPGDTVLDHIQYFKADEDGNVLYFETDEDGNINYYKVDAEGNFMYDEHDELIPATPADGKPLEVPAGKGKPMAALPGDENYNFLFATSESAMACWEDGWATVTNEALTDGEATEIAKELAAFVNKNGLSLQTGWNFDEYNGILQALGLDSLFCFELYGVIWTFDMAYVQTIKPNGAAASASGTIGFLPND